MIAVTRFSAAKDDGWQRRSPSPLSSVEEVKLGVLRRRRETAARLSRRRGNVILVARISDGISAHVLAGAVVCSGPEDFEEARTCAAQQKHLRQSLSLASHKTADRLCLPFAQKEKSRESSRIDLGEAHWLGLATAVFELIVKAHPRTRELQSKIGEAVRETVLRNHLRLSRSSQALEIISSRCEIISSKGKQLQRLCSTHTLSVRTLRSRRRDGRRKEKDHSLHQWRIDDGKAWFLHSSARDKLDVTGTSSSSEKTISFATSSTSHHQRRDGGTSSSHDLARMQWWSSILQDKLTYQISTQASGGHCEPDCRDLTGLGFPLHGSPASSEMRTTLAVSARASGLTFRLDQVSSTAASSKRVSRRTQCWRGPPYSIAIGSNNEVSSCLHHAPSLATSSMASSVSVRLRDFSSRHQHPTSLLRLWLPFHDSARARAYEDWSLSTRFGMLQPVTSLLWFHHFTRRHHRIWVMPEQELSCSL
ncbi:hypothetical protein DY000_02034038 [Brassica cretica]|uniref:Uncharacterized protein n=1 Tax=Brassica cretica TaxID=69181 RepID=A0ABQ7DFT8_BRACR|nr:hypothetical protein DY000_02034038 [Brassica cretica]